MAKVRFDNPEELKRQIDAYFEGIARDERPPTMSGLAYELGVTRRTLCNYIRDNDKDGKGKNAQCCALLVQAKARIEMWLEEQLVIRAKTAGVQFALKNNYEWDEKVAVSVDGETRHSGAVGVVDATRLTDEELLTRINTLTEKVREIHKREGVEEPC